MRDNNGNFFDSPSIDKRWAGRPDWCVALGILVAGLLSVIVLRGTHTINSFGEMMTHMSAVIGWGLALIVCSFTSLLPAVESGSAY